MKICSICQGENPDKAKKCISCGNKFKKPIYKRGWFILLTIFCIFGVSLQISSIQKEKELQKAELQRLEELQKEELQKAEELERLEKMYNNSNIDVKGLFILDDDWKNSDENFMDLSNNLKNDETYMFLAYDIINDTTKNINISGNISIILNDENTYKNEYISNVIDDNGYLESFMKYSGYEIKVPNKINGLSDPIRTLQVFKVNKNDIDEQSTAEVYFNLSENYAAKVKFESQDIIPISYFDDIFQIEEFPKEYQTARSIYTRLLFNQSYLNTISQITTKELLDVAEGVHIVIWSKSISLASNPTYSKVVFYDFDNGEFDSLWLAKVYPEISDLVEEIIKKGNELIDVRLSDTDRGKELYSQLHSDIQKAIEYFEKL